MMTFHCLNFRQVIQKMMLKYCEIVQQKNALKIFFAAVLHDEIYPPPPNGHHFYFTVVSG